MSEDTPEIVEKFTVYQIAPSPVKHANTIYKNNAVRKEVMERRKNVRSWKEKFHKIVKIGEEPGLVAPEKILGKKPEFSSDHFKKVLERRE